jgi:hypothetical protein
MMPNAVANSWTAYAAEHGPGNWPWYVTAHAICARSRKARTTTGI